jgi:hypothetical protein
MAIERYCQAGHKFIINGVMAVGETISVTVVPNTGYLFDRWFDGNTDNPRQFTIPYCGITYVAHFVEGELPDPLADVFTALENVLNGGTSQDREYERSSITEEDVETQLTEIIG